ncbi:MAG: peroxidase-related enzyme [Pseudomonadota bacterium]
MPHMKPLAVDAVADDIRDRFEHYRQTRGFTPNSIMTMARRPNIVRAFMQLNQAVLYEGSVPEELKMLISLIASQVAGCRYCQAHMANLSSIYKASEEKISRVWEFENSDLFSAAERAALRVAYHGAMSPAQATQADFDALYEHFNEEQVVEIVASIALFGFLNRWNDTMATEIEDLPADVAERTLGATFNWEPGKHSS